MIFGSVCSGIEAASVAFKPLGWKAAFFSEIEKFPSQVLKHHHPDVPNHGDMTQFKEWTINEPIKLLCGGTPCQSFSVAGLRKGLDDARGNLMLTFGEMAAKLRPQWIFWENVPGVLSSSKGADFGAFLGLISGRTIPVPNGGWGKSGIIPGYRNAYGIAYRIFDAQYFGVAQRRRRVFVVGYIGDWRPAAAVLFERTSMCGNPAPRREKGEDVAGSPADRAGIRSHWDGGPHPSLSQSHNTGGIGQSNQELFSQRGAGLVGALDTQCGFEKTTHQSIANGHQMAVSTHRMPPFGEYVDDGTASAMKARDYKDATDLVTYPINTQIAMRHEKLGHGTGMGIGDESDPSFTLQANHSHAVAHTLRGEGFDASEDGTGRQNLVPLVSDTLVSNGDAHSGFRDEKGRVLSQTAFGVGESPDLGHCLRSGASKADKHESTTYVAAPVAFAQNTRDEVREMPYVGALAANAGMKQTSYIRNAMAVRRLTPEECEALQGFPRGYTNVPDTKGKPAADGPRYKALGNSWAVPNVAWIARRIDFVEKVKECPFL